MATEKEDLATYRDQLRSFNQAAKAKYLLDPEAASEIVKQTDYATRSTAYRSMVRFARSELGNERSLKDIVGWTAGNAGFTAMSILLAHAPDRYAAYCRRKGIRAEPNELGAALISDTSVLATLLSTPDRTEIKLEKSLRIHHELSKTVGLKFDDTDKGAAYAPSGPEFAVIAKEPEYVDDKPKHWQRCPARRLVLENIWPELVTLAVEVPELFPYDLARLQPTGTTVSS